MTPHEDGATKILSLVSHKLRTPLSIINGYSEAIAANQTKDKLPPFTEKALEEIAKQGNKMAILIDKLLRFAQVESMSNADLKPVQFALKPVIQETAALCMRRHENKALHTKNNVITNGSQTIEINCPDDLDIYADKELFAGVLDEMIDNALKFNNHIETSIKVFCYKQASSVAVSVKDSGSGIRPQDINKIFEKFYQVDDFFTGQIEGWGLGLALIKKICELHGGSVTVVSDKGLGSVFTVTLPN